MEKVLKWFASPAGSKAVYYSVGVGSIGLMLGYGIPNTVLLHKYQEVVQCYKYGMPVKLTPQVLDRYNKALDLLNISERDRRIIKPFMVFGFDIFSAGTLQSKWGGLVGIPLNFTYVDGQPIEKQDIMVNNEPVMWATEPGQQLINSLVLSENAQVFAIAREILSLKSIKLLLNTIYASTCLIFTYGLTRRINEKFYLYDRPRIFRGGVYCLATIFGYGVYSFLTDFTQVRHDMKVDRKLSELHPSMVEGGKEFYEKTILRNMALRQLMGKTGHKYYTALGNENFFIRQKRLPLVVRKQFFENKINSL